MHWCHLHWHCLNLAYTMPACASGYGLNDNLKPQTSHLKPPMSRLSQALQHLDFARRYTLERLAGIDQADWFHMPGGVTHVAWQVGHLAMADYRLLLERVRAAREEDAQLISQEFLALFGKGSTPQEDAGLYPSCEEIVAVFTRVRAAGLEEVRNLADEELDNPALKPHRLFKTKLGSVQWCGDHELMHAGQLGLLKRLLGSGPDW